MASDAYDPWEAAKAEATARADIREALTADPPRIPDMWSLEIEALLGWAGGRIDEALAASSLRERQGEISANELQNRGLWALYQGDAGGALAAFDSALALEPDFPDSSLGRAYALFYLECYSEAAEVFRSLLGQFSSPEVMLDASLAMAAGEEPKQIVLPPLIGLPPGIAEVLQERQLNGVEAAIARANTLLSSVEPSYRCAFRRLVVGFILERGEQPGAMLDEALAECPEDGELWLIRGVAAVRAGSNEDALPAFERCTELAPLKAHAWAALAATQLQLGDLPGATKSYGVALLLDDSRARFWAELGMTQAARELWEEAIESLDRAEELGAGDFSLYFNRGLSYLQLERLVEAVTDFDRAANVEPGNPQAEEARELLRQLSVPSDDDRRYIVGADLDDDA